MKKREATMNKVDWSRMSVETAMVSLRRRRASVTLAVRPVLYVGVAVVLVLVD